MRAPIFILEMHDSRLTGHFVRGILAITVFFVPAGGSACIYSVIGHIMNTLLATKEMSTRHRAILRRVILGESGREIAEALDMSTQIIHEITTSPLFIAEKTRAERDIVDRVTDVKARIVKAAEPAMDTIESILNGRAALTNITNLERMAAQDILDRAGFGKIEKKIVAHTDMATLIRIAHERRTGQKEERDEDSDDKLGDIIDVM